MFQNKKHGINENNFMSNLSLMTSFEYFILTLLYILDFMNGFRRVFTIMFMNVGLLNSTPLFIFSGIAF